MVVWGSEDISVGNQDVRGIFVDLPTTSIVGSDFLLHNNRTSNQNGQTVKLGNSYGLVCFSSGATGAQDMYCRALDVLNRQVLGADEILVGTTAAQDQVLPRIEVVNDTAYVAWRSEESGSWSYRGQVINLATQTLVSGTNFIVTDRIYSSPLKPDDIYGANMPELVNSGNNVLLFWANNEGMYSQRLVPNTLFPLPYGMNNFLVAPLIERNYTVRAKLRY